MSTTDTQTSTQAEPADTGSGDGSDDSSTDTETTPPSASYPNLPPGMEVIGVNDGSVKESNGSAFGIADFGGWSSSAENLEVVADPTNPTGSRYSLRGAWGLNGHDGPGVATADTFSGGPYTELYMMVRIYFEDGGWDFGQKFFYVGATASQRNNASSPTQLYADRPSGGFPQRLRMINQNGGTNPVVSSNDDPPNGTNASPLVAEEWLNMEFHYVGSSSPGADDGAMYIWVNDVLIGSNTQVTWITAFDGMQWYGNTSSTTSPSHYRIGELFIAGK